MKITPIVSPFPGEHVATTFPVMRPETADARWRLRLNFWAGRSLTADALELEQDNRASRLAWRGRLATPGIVRGLGVGLEAPVSPAGAASRDGHFLHLLPGHAFLLDGEDVVVPRPLRVPLSSIPVHYVRIGSPEDELPIEPPLPDTEVDLPRQAGGFEYHVDTFDPTHTPWAAVLVLCPAEYRAFAGVDPEDPCELDASRDAFADERRVDACVLRLCQLPESWRSLPRLRDPADPRWRNRLADVVLAHDASRSARHILHAPDDPASARWGTRLRGAEPLPWELLGVPIALLSRETVAGADRFFLDRAAVVRSGGLARPRSRPALRTVSPEGEVLAAPPGVGSPSSWRARVDQFAEQLGEMRGSEDLFLQARRFQFLPAAGFLPRAALSLLTTREALLLPAPAGQPPDRAGTNLFFPPSFAVQAVPVALEDLDAVLAASAPLAPYDCEVEGGDTVRLLVPVPQRVFDPHLLVVEQEDPIFAQTVARFVALRQGWRQRRDLVRGHRDELQMLAEGPRPALSSLLLERGQLEREPVEALDQLPVRAAFRSPSETAGPWDLTVAITASPVVDARSFLYVILRVDEEYPAATIEARWTTSDGGLLRFAWSDVPPAPLETFDELGQSLPTPLWRRLVVSGAELGLSGEVGITEFTLHVTGGRVAIGALGASSTRDAETGAAEGHWWRAEDGVVPASNGGEWTRVSGALLLAPFEEVADPVFPDGRSLQVRVTEVEEALNPAAATPRTVPMSVTTVGLRKAIAELDAEASEADDFVDTTFARAQVNLYRIRRLLIGEAAAQKLLINPAIAAIAEQDSALASAEQLGTFLAAAKKRSVSFTSVNDALGKPAVTAVEPNSGVRGATIKAVITGTNLTRATDVRVSGTGVTVKVGTGSATSLPVSITIDAEAALGARTLTVTAGGATSQPFPGFTVGVASGGDFNPRSFFFDRQIVEPTTATFTTMTTHNRASLSFAAFDVKADIIKDIVNQRPEVGPTLLPRGLTIGERFKEPPATQNLSYARAALNELLNELPRLRIPLVGQTVRGLGGHEVSLLDLQGRTRPGTGTTAAALRQAAVDALLQTTPLTQDTDEAEVTLAALDFSEIQSAILRTIERVVQRQRAIVTAGVETLNAVIGRGAADQARVLAIEGRLAEARHDVSVARALQQEERRRITNINARRDALIADEVRFLAYVRPRTVDTVRRTLPSWRIDAFGTPAPVPACLRQHEEAPAELRAYIQLFRHTPVRWFPEFESLLDRLDTPDKLVALLEAARTSAAAFATVDTAMSVRASTAAVQVTVMGAHQAITAMRQLSTSLQIADRHVHRWQDFRADAVAHATVGDLVAGRHGAQDVSATAAAGLEQIARVATCLHAEFAAVAPAVRLLWIERFSQFDRPASLRDLTVLPEYGRLDRTTRRRLQEFVDWLFGRVTTDRGAMALVNDLVRLCLLLASHAPVARIIAGHVPRPTPVRPGIRIPIKPLNPELVRVGMEFHVWHASRVVASGRVEDLADAEVSVRVDQVEGQLTTLDTSMRVQFVTAALGFSKS